jgi:serine/threonine protein kinase
MTLCINPRCSKPQNSNNTHFCQACGSEVLLQGRYRAVSELGSGGFGKTYEVSDQGTPKVLKILINTAPKAISLFKREAQVLSQLIYPGIPRVEAHGYFEHPLQDGQAPVHCFVMEKIEGDNLHSYIRKRGRPIDGEMATRWLIELLLILQQVHNQGILHRDIKPQNIILKPDGKLALIDFGAVTEGTGTQVATEMSKSGGTQYATQTGGGTSIWTRGYAPIEQINGEAVPQSDFFGLGRTFVFLLTGKEPTDRTIYDASNDELKWHNHASGVSPQLAKVIDHMIARLARERPVNAQAILDQIGKIESPNPGKRNYVESTPSVIPQKEVIRETVSTRPSHQSTNSSKQTKKSRFSFGSLGVSLFAMIAIFYAFSQIQKNRNYTFIDGVCNSENGCNYNEAADCTQDGGCQYPRDVGNFRTVPFGQTINAITHKGTWRGDYEITAICDRTCHR